jgi:hypothetical protein
MSTKLRNINELIIIQEIELQIFNKLSLLKFPPQKVWPPRFNKYIVPILFSVLTPGAGIAAVGAGLDVDVTGIP